MGRYTESRKLNSVRTPASMRAPDDPNTDCSTEVLRAFGLLASKGERRTGNMIKDALEHAGYTVERLWSTCYGYRAPSLKTFMAEHPTGDFVLITVSNRRGHAMALQDGALTDTDLTGTARRRIHLAYRVTREGDNG